MTLTALDFLIGTVRDFLGKSFGAHFQNSFQDLDPNAELYSAQTGQLVLPLGLGNTPQLQP